MSDPNHNNFSAVVTRAKETFASPPPNTEQINIPPNYFYDYDAGPMYTGRVPDTIPTVIRSFHLPEGLVIAHLADVSQMPPIRGPDKKFRHPLTGQGKETADLWLRFDMTPSNGCLADVSLEASLDRPSAETLDTETKQKQELEKLGQFQRLAHLDPATVDPIIFPLLERARTQDAHMAANLPGGHEMRAFEMLDNLRDKLRAIATFPRPSEPEGLFGAEFDRRIGFANAVMRRLHILPADQPKGKGHTGPYGYAAHEAHRLVDVFHRQYDTHG